MVVRLISLGQNKKKDRKNQLAYSSLRRFVLIDCRRGAPGKLCTPMCNGKNNSSSGHVRAQPAMMRCRGAPLAAVHSDCTHTTAAAAAMNAAVPMANWLHRVGPFVVASGADILRRE